MDMKNNLATETTWEIFETRYFPEQAVTTGSNYMIGNGYLGYRGTFSHNRAADRVACVLTDTYDNADGKWKELATAPNGLFTEFKPTSAASASLWEAENAVDYRRTLDFRYGEWIARGTGPESGISLQEERFCSCADLHLITSRMLITAEKPISIEVWTGIDGAVWSLNGDHYSSISPREEGEQLEISCVTGEHRYDVIVREYATLLRDDGSEVRAGRVVRGEREIYRVFPVDLPAGRSVTLYKYVGLFSTNDLRDVSVVTSNAERGPRPLRDAVQEAAVTTVTRAANQSWDELRAAHRAVWDRRWEAADISIAGDDLAQTVVRYNMYHNFIATPAHADHLPIGARGLSCQAYQGAAFWDQEIFNLPMFLFTEPEIARRILIYRYRTLDGARKKARDLGYRGAYYAWVSGDTGEEICPSYFFRDVISGRRIRNHFNDWQIHISPDIAYTIWKYVYVTGDGDFLEDYGAEILFEIARFLVSRTHYRKDLDRYEVIRVLGPDEYHENVDNNFFTNYQIRFVARYAAQVYNELEKGSPAVLGRLQRTIGLSSVERDDWEDLAQRIHVPAADPETGLIEQFERFFDLEDTRPEIIRERLLDQGEYWGWPNGVAVETQVSKQADVVQLFVLHPQAFDRNVMRANWEYYEPRTQHGSSLSYAVYATCAAWLEHMDEAYRYFIRSCTVDLYNTGKAVSGGTFIGGIHTAACGVAWQIVVNGFLGMYVTEAGFGFNPRLPPGWREVSLGLKRGGDRVRLTVNRDEMTVRADAGNSSTLEVCLGDERHKLGPGDERALRAKA
jgi:1,2-alpha-glucosylglycerol phosphorylase